MLVGIDASRSVASEPTGTEIYSQELIRELLRLDGGVSFRLYFNRPPAPGLSPPGPGWEKVVMPWPRLWTHLRLGWEVARRPPDVLFVPAHVLPLVHPTPSVVTIHDLGYLRYPLAHPWKDRWYLDLTTRFMARAASHLIVPSQATKGDLVECYRLPPEKVTVVYPGYGAQFRPVEDGERIEVVKERYAIRGDYFLHVGTLQPRKNLARLLEAFSLFRGRVGGRMTLALAGVKGWLTEGFFRRLEELGLGESVRLLGYVPQEALPALYGGAKALVFPSLYEGFGLPLLEAMACGLPALASSASSLPEVAGGAALLVDPLDTEAIAEGMRRIVEDEGLREELAAKGLRRAKDFSWDRCARETLAVLKGAVEAEGG